MEALTLISDRDRPIKPIVEAALENELRLVQAGIRQTKRNLAQFERKHNIETQAFVTEYENDNWPETMESIEWIGEFRLLARLMEKAEAIESVHPIHHQYESKTTCAT